MPKSALEAEASEVYSSTSSHSCMHWKIDGHTAVIDNSCITNT